MTDAPLDYLLSARSKKMAVPIVFLKTSELKKWLEKADKASRSWVKANAFTASAGEMVHMPDTDKNGACILWGLGDEALGEGTIPDDPLVYAKIASQLKPGTYQLPDNLSTVRVHAAALGWGLANYRFDRFKTEPKKTGVLLKTPSKLNVKKLTAELNGMVLVRDLINMPTNAMLPSDLTAAARKLARNYDAKVKVTVGDKLLSENFPIIHAVGRASSDAPRLIDLRWGKAKNPKLTLVGKGVCFDSGGLGIKQSAGMRIMKKDMGGAAHALGLASMIMALGLNVRLRVIIPAVENSISGNAFRPGDIIRSRAGKTVEIGHTDAEGRLVLSDALSLACEEKPDLLLDFATLTGAARVALGPDLPAMFTDDDKLAQQFEKSSKALHDPLWRLPLWPGYAQDIKSEIADLNNVAEHSFAGAIIGGLFLKEFVAPGITWAHFDVYGWNATNRPGKPKGGEATTLRAVLDVVEKRYS